MQLLVMSCVEAKRTNDYSNEPTLSKRRLTSLDFYPKRSAFTKKNFSTSSNEQTSLHLSVCSFFCLS